MDTGRQQMGIQGLARILKDWPGGEPLTLVMTHMEFPLDGINSDDLEKFTHAFIIRVWKEEAGSDDQPALWRGHITHAYTGERQFFQDLPSVLGFIESYLNA